MLDAEVPFDEPDEAGMTALMEASLKGNRAAVDLFVRHWDAAARMGVARRLESLERRNVEPRNVNEKTRGAALKKFERLPGRFGCTALVMARRARSVRAVRCREKSSDAPRPDLACSPCE